jgi:aminopeptidase N
MTGSPADPPQADGAAVDPYLPGHGNAGYTVSRYELDLDYKVASNRLAARARLHATATRGLDRISLDITGLRVGKVMVNGCRAARYSQRSGKLHIWLESAVGAGGALVVDVHYAGRPQPLDGTWGEVGWEELTDGVIVAGQPDGAPSWFPCNDHPSDKASYSIAVTTDTGYHVVANGVLTERMVMSSRERWCYEQVEPMSTYLATVQIGRYTVIETADAPVRQLAAVPQRLQALFRHDFGRQHEMMVLFERLFGPYPFAGYTVVVADDELEIPLEAQGLSVFGRNHLDGRRGAQRLVAHELAHQWFGNSVTAGRWQDIWLHEGFACYAEWLWSEGSGGPSADVLARRTHERLAALPQDIIVGDPGPELMFDDRVYKRGALTLHAVRLTIGDGSFFDTLRAWTRTHAHGTAVTDDFVDIATRHSDKPLRQLFHAWLCQAVLPELLDRPGGRSRLLPRRGPQP